MFDGTVTASIRSEDGQILVVKYGDYEIYYGGLEKTSFKKGDHLKSGQVISFIQKNSIYKSYMLQVTLMKNSVELDPASWFKISGS